MKSIIKLISLKKFSTIRKCVYPNFPASHIIIQLRFQEEQTIHFHVSAYVNRALFYFTWDLQTSTNQSSESRWLSYILVPSLSLIRIALSYVAIRIILDDLSRYHLHSLNRCTKSLYLSFSVSQECLSARCSCSWILLPADRQVRSLSVYHLTE